MSDLYDPQYIRGGYGKFNIHKNFISMEAGTDAYFLEDEANEMQWIQNELRADTVRKQYYSGIFSKLDNDIHMSTEYLSGADTLNSFMVDKLVANVNGYFINVFGNDGLDRNKVLNFIQLPEPPAEGNYYDFVYLEAWFKEIKVNDSIWYNGNINNANGDIANDLFDKRINGETCRRVQLQWTIRSARIQSKDKLFDDSILAGDVPAFGAYHFPSKYGFWNADATLNSKFESDDKGLWIAGAGADDLGTIDGYTYAIPLFKVIRRNVQPYSSFNRLGGKKFKLDEANASDRPDGKFSNIIYPDDVIDVRNIIVCDNISKLLHKNIENLMLGNIRNYEPNMYSTYFGLDKIYTDSNTVVYYDCNKETPIDNANLVGKNYDYNLGVEQEAIIFTNADTYLKYDVNLPNDALTIQLTYRNDLEADKALFTIISNNKEVAQCIRMASGTLRLITDSYTFNYDNDIIPGKFTHIAFGYSKSMGKAYFFVNGKEVMQEIITPNFLTTDKIDTILIGHSSKFDADAVLFDEIEISSALKTSFNQIPQAVSDGLADIAIDTQFGRRNYSLVEATDTYTIHHTQDADVFGNMNFTIKPPHTAIFTTEEPTIQFDNESVKVSKTTWEYNEDGTYTCKIEGLGAGITYNTVIIGNVLFFPYQGITTMPNRAHAVYCEKSDIPFLTVKDTVSSDTHVLNVMDKGTSLNSNNQYIVYNPYVTHNGFCTGIEYQVELNNSDTFTINRSTYMDIYAIHDVIYKNNACMTSVSADKTKFTINLYKKITGTVTVILATKLNCAVYSSAKYGIEELAKFEPIKLYGDGNKTEFIYRSDTKILSCLSTNFVSADNTENEYGATSGTITTGAFVNGVFTPCDAKIDGAFIHLIFKTAPVNKADIITSIVSEYDPLKSERIEFVYEKINIQYPNMQKLHNANIVYYEPNILVTTDGLGVSPISSLDKELCNITYLPSATGNETSIVPQKLTAKSTDIVVPINYVEMKKGGSALVTMNNLHAQYIAQCKRGYKYCDIDNKVYYSAMELKNQVPALAVLFSIVDDNGLKLLVFSEYLSTTTIFVGSEDSAANVYYLDNNYLLKTIK